ncbi:UNVERIFIED_CONTAM: hypothetical protein H355_011868 [Colinus virginianus]|nr:hypothetical protein H355_011868 [Colinus virginianus]
MLYWQNEDDVVHFHHGGHDDLKYQDKQYHGRTSLFLNEVKHGNFSLKLSNVQLQDEAVYSCIYSQSGHQTQKSKVKLHVSDTLSTGEKHLSSAFLVKSLVTCGPPGFFSGHTQISLRSAGEAPHLDVLLSIHLLVALGVWHLSLGKLTFSVEAVLDKRDLLERTAL